jgi:hypothetical protein
MRTSLSGLSNILFLVIVFVFTSCKKNRPVSDTITPPPPVIGNNPPGQFSVSLIASSSDTATINWTKAVDPDNDSVTYKVYLNDTLKADSYKTFSYTFRSLKELISYNAKVVAADSKGNQTSSVLSFTTKKYWLKFLKAIDYGISSQYTSKKCGEMTKANDGGYIIVGDVELADWPTPPFKMCAIKIDSLGNKIWEKRYDYTVANSFEIRIASFSNGYIICGGDNIIRINNNGDLVWRQTTGNQQQTISAIVVNTDHTFYAAGLVASDSANGNIDEALLAKFDENGNLLWKKTYSPTTRDEIHDIKIYNNELIALCVTDDAHPHFRVLKLALDGTILWDKEYPSPWGYVFPTNIIKTREGNFVFCGFFQGIAYVPYMYLAMIDNNGNSLWTYYSNDNNTRANSVAETNDNNLIVTGGYQFTYSAQSALYKFAKNGNTLWYKLYEEFATTFLNKTVIPTSDGGYIMNSQKSKAYNDPGETDQIYIFKTDDKGEFN